MYLTKSPLLAALSACFILQPVAATTYNVLKEYAGATFFDDWVFYNSFDNLTNGDVQFVSAQEGVSAKLAFVDPGTNRAIIKVDNTTTVPFNEKRKSVRISSKDRYPVGSVWVADMFHVPYGCSVWPAWWSQSPAWPQGGEIDTFEGVNLQPHNQMGLHTLPGCTSVSSVQAQTSKQQSTDCSNLANNNEGCIVIDQNPASYGEAFAQAGGGVFVTEFAQEGISIWFYPRANVPDALKSNTKAIDTSTLGTPTGNWPATGCSMDKFFEPQNLILDITLCGDFAKPPQIFLQTCKGLCYEDFVVGDGGAKYATAYFDIASVRVYGAKAVTPGGGSGGGSTGNGSTGNDTTGGGKNAAEGRWAGVTLMQMWIGLVFVGSLHMWQLLM